MSAHSDYVLGIDRSAGISASEPSVYYSRTAQPSVEPIDINDAVRHLQLAAGDDNSYIQTLISVARDVAERTTGRAMLTQSWSACMSGWPTGGCVLLTVTPVASVASVQYYAEGETSLTTLDAGNYILATGVTPAALVFNEDFDAPALASRPDAVRINFVAGAATPNAVDPSLRHAVRILLRHYYDNPEAAASGSFSELPFSLRHLLESHRVAGWVA